MKPAEQLSDFVAKALTAGRNRTEIETALRDAGWQDAEVARALSAWSETAFLPPVPRPRTTVSARDALFYGLLFSALAMAVFYINALGFDLIDRAFADPVEGYQPQWQNRSIRWSIAVLVVVVPAFLLMTRHEQQHLRADPSRRRSALRKWFAAVALFLAVLGLAGDVIATIYAFLNGDLTLQFLLKAALVALTAVLVLLYLRQETESPDAA